MNQIDTTNDSTEAPHLGVMLVGALGMTATAVVGGARAMKRGVVSEQYGTTSHPAFVSTPLRSAQAMTFGGWEYQDTGISKVLAAYGHLPVTVSDVIRDDDLMLFAGLWTSLEYPLRSDQRFVRRPTSLVEGAGFVANDITTFRSRTGCDQVIVVFVGTPARECEIAPPVFDMRAHGADLLPSGLMYAIGAADAGAHFIDFTPSRTLEYRSIWEHAAHCGVQIAGRDGSTGQTMLKVALAEMLSRRGISISAWYSTNLIGNRDGLVLSQPAYAAPKIADKTDALGSSHVLHHRVAIEYLPPWGDAKESWDAVECHSWLGAPLSIRVNWHGRDSQLAGALILDLIRLMDRGATLGHRGFQPQLGFFFKKPFLREESTLSERWSELVSAYVS